jgi:hypothetical protein
MYLITFIKRFFSFTFYNKFVEISKLFPTKTTYYVKRQIIKNFKKFVCLEMELVSEPEPELFLSRIRNQNHNFFKCRNRNHNFSKVGTGTVKIS